MLFLYNLLSCIGYFLIMLIFMILALTSAKPQFAWVWYIIGGISQFISLLGNQNVIQNITWYWVIYFAILIVVAALIINRSNSSPVKEKENKNETIEQQTSKDYTETNHTILENAEVVEKFEEVDKVDEVKVKNEKQIINKVQFCRKCGSKLMDDAIFCHRCGTSVHIQESLAANCAKFNDTVILQDTKKAKRHTKKPKRLSWLWITIIVFNCCTVIAGIIASVYPLCYDICMRMVTTWRYLNIDSNYQVGYSTEEYSNQISWIDEEILWISITSIGIIFVFVALSILNSYICKKKLNIKQKKIRALPWLCTLIVMVLVCGGIALSSVFEYKDDIVYYQQEAEEERIAREKQLEEEQVEMEKELAYQAKEKELQLQATTLLKYKDENMRPSEVWEYVQRYPEKSIGLMVKIKGYINFYSSSMYLENSSYLYNKNIELIYGTSDKNKPRLLDNDYAIVVGMIVKSEYENVIQIKIYDWEILN